MGFTDSLKLAWNAMAVDFRSGSQGNDAAATAQHVMSGLNAGVHDSASVAMANGQRFINSQLAAAGAENGISLGNAIHAIGDKYSPAHQGADWDGFSAIGILGTLKHVFADTFPGLENISGAYSESRAAIEAARGGSPQPYLNSPYNIVRPSTGSSSGADGSLSGTGITPK